MNIATYEKGIEYIQKGFSIIPVGSDKKPLTSWKINQTEKISEEDFSRYSKQFPNMNIGIVTGSISQITVIDIDTKSGQANNLLSKFPPTYTVKTPSGGYHLYYKYQQGFTVSANAYPDLPYVDIRGDSGFVVAPPSITPNGEYTIINDTEIQPFPLYMFPQVKPKKSLMDITTAKNGSRNDSITSLIGLLLQATSEEKWATEVLPVALSTNRAYTQPLPENEVIASFNSIVKKETERRSNLNSIPIIIEGTDTGEKIKMAKTRSGIPFMNMSNVVAILEAHPDFRKKIKYNSFTQEIEINSKAIQDEDTIKIQHTLQTQFGLHSITNEAVYSALVHCSYTNRYDEAQEWLTSLKWDGEKRLFTWLSRATHVEDNEYHRGVGTQWFIGMVKRIMHPGCIFDYMLVLVGGQGIGKTSLFREIGGKWYKSFTGGIDGKDFYMQMRGAILMDLDEGATLYKSEAIKIKSIITTTHDEFRAPYDRIPKKYPRHFVFSMSTNDVEPFRDATGNRRYWPVDLPNEMVNFDFIVNQREQLFAEALYWLRNPSIEIPEVPIEEALSRQEQHLPDDSWTDKVVETVRRDDDYCVGNPNYSTTIIEVFMKVFPEESLLRLDKKQEMRIANIFRKQLGLDKRQITVDGERKNRWFITDEMIKRMERIKVNKTTEPLDEF